MPSPPNQLNNVHHYNHIYMRMQKLQLLESLEFLRGSWGGFTMRSKWHCKDNSSAFVEKKPLARQNMPCEKAQWIRDDEISRKPPTSASFPWRFNRQREAVRRRLEKRRQGNDWRGEKKRWDERRFVNYLSSSDALQSGSGRTLMLHIALL